MSTNLVNKTTGELTTLANGTRVWIGSKSAHDLAVQQGTMPNNCMVCITDDGADNEPWEYSTEETKTGKTWIDGKPIYRKCCVLTSAVTVSSASEWVNLINKSTYGLESIEVITQGWVWRQANKGPVNGLALSPGSAGYIQAHREGVTWELNVGSMVILEYTKTTDA